MTEIETQPEAEALERLQDRLGHRFVRRELLEKALTHRSLAHEEGHESHYERLEFLGDAVLGLVSAAWLFAELPGRSEGELAKRKSYLVSAPVLAEHARCLGIGECLRLGVGEERSGGREKPSLLADALEAVLGALYLDGGLEVAWGVVVSMLERTSRRPLTGVARDPKTALQERVQALGWGLPDYRVVAASGPDHLRSFIVECWIAGELRGTGQGPSKKRAEQRAAAAALHRLERAPEPAERNR
jgi:ribonuclease-3